MSYGNRLIHPPRSPRPKISGYVASSENLVGNDWAEVCRILGFHPNRFDLGGTVYRIQPGIIEDFVSNPLAHFRSLQLVPVGHNDERGKRDWDTMKDIRSTGYTSASIIRDKHHYIRPRAQDIEFVDTPAAMNQLVAEMASMLFNKETIVKIIPDMDHNGEIESFIQYPAGAGIREYVLKAPQSFEEVRRFEPIQVNHRQPFLLPRDESQ